MTMAAHYNNSIIDLSTCSSSDDEEDTTSFHCEQQQQQRRRRLTTMPNLTSTSPSPCLRGGYRQRLLSLHRHRNGNHHAAASSSAAAAAASTSSSAAATRERRAERPEIIEISSSPSLSPLDRTTSRTTKKMSSSDKQQARARARQWAENNLASMSSSSSSRARVDNAPTVTAGVAAPIQRHMSLSAARDEARARARQWAQGTAAANAITSSGSGRQLDSEDVEDVEEEEDDDDDDIPDDPMSESSMSSAEESPSLHPRQQPFAQPATTTTTATTGTTTTTSVSYSWVSRAPSSSTTPSTNVSLQRQQPTILAPPPSSPSSLSDTFSRHQQLFDQQFNGFAQQFNGASFVRLGSGNQIAQWSSSPSVHLESLQPQLRLHNIDSILATAAAATAEAEAITAAAATATAAAVRPNCATARATATAAIARANSATSRAAAFESLQEEEEDSLEDEEDSLDDDDDESSTESRRDQEDAQVWSCPQCTLHNPMFRVQCDACQYVNRTLILGTGVASRQLSFHASFGGGGGGGGEWGRDRTRAIPQMTAIPQRIRPFNQPALQSENMGYERLLEIFGDGSENMRRGASSSIISALPSVNIVDPERQLPEDKRECSICLEEFCGGEVRTSLPCLHGFHSGCVNRWLQSNGSCPVCKTSVS